MTSKRKSLNDCDEDTQGKLPRTAIRPKLRQDLLNETIVQKLQNVWENSDSDNKGNDVEIISDPFRICIVKQFLDDRELCGALKNSFLEHSLQRKESDLFSFYQSEDLSTIDDPEVAELVSFLETDCRDWVRSITGLALDGGVSSTLSVYDHGDHLLCHDDKFEDRRVAFILYLNSDWRPEYGGDLQIFNTYENNLPKEVVRSILPENNTFVFFEVADNSFHQVAEVLVENDLRVTVNGWFHGLPETSAAAPAPVSKPHPGPEDLAVPPVTLEGLDLSEIINAKYLSQQGDYCSQFEADSEMLLPSFLRKDMYQQIAEELSQNDVTWSQLYLPDHKRYEVCEVSSAGPHVRRLLDVLGSSSFFSLLGTLTGLSLSQLSQTDTPSAGSSRAVSKTRAGPKGHYELQRWRSSCYSLAKDSDFQLSSAILELYLFFNCDTISSDGDCSITYIATSEEDKLLTVDPMDNMAALVYRDDGTAKFVKYITSKFTGACHIVSCSYFE